MRTNETQAEEERLSTVLLEKFRTCGISSLEQQAEQLLKKLRG